MPVTLTTRHRARARGCLLGQLTGDALGTTVEFSKAAAIARRYPDGLRDIVGGGPFNVLPGQVTDDSELALSLARALAAHGADFDAIARSYVEWCWSDPFDIGGTTLNAFHFARGTAIDERTVATNAADYNGHPSRQANGSLMRVSPLGIFGAFADPHRQKPQSFIALTRREDLQLSHASLYALVRVGQQLEELTPSVAHALTVRHHRALLPLSDAKSKASLAKKAVTKRWTAAQLEDAVRAQLPATRHGRTPLPPVVKEFRALRRTITSGAAPLDAFGDLSDDQRQELQDALEALEARLAAVRAALEGAVS